MKDSEITYELTKYVADRGISVVQAMQKIDDNGKGILFLIDEEEVLLGCVTDGDIRRWIIKTADLSASVDMFMTTSPYYVKIWETESAEVLIHEKSISAVPIVDDDFRIHGIVVRSAYNSKGSSDDSLKGVPVVIMAGGMGTRLYPYTKILPKPLIPIGDVPIVERIIEKFVVRGVDKIYMTVNYKKGMIRSYFDEISRDYEISYVEETKPLGTGGSIKLIKERFDKPIIVTNCDILIQANLGEIYKFHKESGNDITIVSSVKNTTIPYGVLKIKENGIVEEMQEKPSLSNLINTGMYVLNPELIEMIPDETFFHMTHLVDECIATGRQVGIFPISEDSYLDMGELEEMRRMEDKLKI